MDISTDFKEDDDCFDHDEIQYSIKCSTNKSIEGESTDDLDMDDNEMTEFDKMSIREAKRSEASDSFPKLPCFSEFDGDFNLEMHAPLIQLINHTLTTAKRNRYAILFSDKLVVFKKPEHKVSKFQIPIEKIIKIDDSIGNSKFKVETPIKVYKFMCSKPENVSIWVKNINKLMSNSVINRPTVVLKESVFLQDVDNNRIFTIEDNFTVAYYESKEYYDHNIAMHRIKLKSSGVKKDKANNNTLHLITSYRPYILTFESSSICEIWFNKISEMIHKSISQTSLSKTAKSGQNILQELCLNKSNRFCVECGNEPEWASINLFITLCSRCAGFHRGLGPNVSRIQGIYHDEKTWEDKMIIKLFQLIGNDKANQYWFYNQPESYEIDQRFIEQKYVKKKFIKPNDSNDKNVMNREIINAINNTDVIKTMIYFHYGVDLEYFDNSLGMTIRNLALNTNDAVLNRYLDCQSKMLAKDWRKGLFDINNELARNTYNSRAFKVIFNKEIRKNVFLQIKSNHLKLMDAENKSIEYANVSFENFCLISKKEETCDMISLLVILKDSEMRTFDENFIPLNTLEIFKDDRTVDPDIQDLKNILAEKMCPKFELKISFSSMGWVLLSNAEQDWKPYLLILQTNRIIHFYDPININSEKSSFTLDIRKVTKVEELKDFNFEGSCPFTAYNLASICLCSLIIYHIRSETKLAHDELFTILKSSWEIRDCNLANQILTNNNVPLAVHKMIEYLQNTAIIIEGPFRRGGRVSEAEKIYKKLVSDPNSFVLKDQNPDDVASALKMFFRQLDDPLLTRKLYNKWVEVAQYRDMNDQLSGFKNLLSQLPIVNYSTLRRIILLLVNIVENNNETQMTPDTLSTSFSTCFLISSSQQYSFRNQDLLILPFLINHYIVLFDITNEEVEVENKIRNAKKNLDNINKIQLESSMIRQVHISLNIEKYFQKDLKISKEKIDGIELFQRQVPIKSNYNVDNLKNMFFNEEHFDSIVLVEEKKIEDFKMERVIYPQENLFKVIETSELLDARNKAGNNNKKFIFKFNYQNISFKLQDSHVHLDAFGTDAYLSTSSKNKIYIEISDTNQLNIWKNSNQDEILSSLSVKNLNIFKFVGDSKNLLAFDDMRNQEDKKTGMAKLVHHISLKTRSAYNFITIPVKADYERLLWHYHHARIFELTPIIERPGVAKIQSIL